MKRSDITDVMVCEVFAEFDRSFYAEPSGVNIYENGYPHDVLMERHGAPFKVVYAAMERTSDRGFIDYGVSLRTGWLTAKGRVLLGDNA